MHPWCEHFNIPRGTKGRFTIAHHVVAANKSINLVNDWQKAMGIIKYQEPLVFNKPTRWHILKDETGVWMTDYPQEQYQSDVLLAPIQSGKVLTSGLGLGYAASILQRRPEITQVDVVEKEADIIDLVARHIPNRLNKIHVIHDDLFDFLERCDGGYDWVFYDIWKSAEDDVFFDYIIPLIDMTLPWLPQERIICWNEDLFRRQMEMYLQIGMTVIDRSTVEEKKVEFEQRLAKTGDPHHDWAIPFFQRVKEGDVTADNIAKEAREYSDAYGRTIHTQLEDE